MARKHNLAEVLQTEVTGTMPLKTLAKVLASKGRRGDTMLAHITPKEAKKLKKAGGSGTTNPETGLPEFFGEDGFDYPTYEAPAPVETPAAPVEQAPVSLPTFAQSPEYTSPTYYGGEAPGTIQPSGGAIGPTTAQTGLYYETPYASQFAGGLGGEQALPSGQYAGGLSDIFNFGGQPQQGTAVSATGVPLPPPRGLNAQETADYYSQGATPEDQGVQTQIQPTSEDVAKAQGGDTSGLLGKMGLSDLLKLGVGGIGALMGRSQQQAAIKQAAAAAQQYKDAAAAAAQQYKDLAQPLLGPGYSALSQAQQGALSAANRQAFDVARARAAQASARSGGVGAVQTAMEEGRMYQQLVSNQLQQAMTLIAPGNSLAMAAISTTLAGQQGALGLQLQLEQQANQAATNMYSAIAKMVA